MNICINCHKKYKTSMLYNYNLDLCEKCFKKFEEEGKIDRDEWCDKVTHKITCPKCNKIYDRHICHEKCKTKNCNVWFFWDDLDGQVFARWLTEDPIDK